MMTITPEQVTNMVIKWLDAQAYSKTHWMEVAQEMLKRNHHQHDLAIADLAKALESFHQLYKSKVVKPDNLLDELLCTCFALVDWEKVAKSRY